MLGISHPRTVSVTVEPPKSETPAQPAPVIVSGAPLSLDEIARVARDHAHVYITHDHTVIERVEAAHAYIQEAVAQREAIYGVTTGFGGMANIVISPEDATELQNNMLWYHRTGAGRRLPLEDVRAAMLLRMNSHLQGASGIRMELIRRMGLFLNKHVTPLVHEFGSIGASGDLVPLTSIAGALVGLDNSFRVDFAGREMGACEALERLGLPKIELQPKEGLAMLNGTSVMTGIAAMCAHDAKTMLMLSMGAHALMAQGLRATNQSFHPMIHDLKPHDGQRWAAACMLRLLDGSSLIRDELHGHREHRENELIQDRYSLRCLPQFIAPIYDGIVQVMKQMETEARSVSDNPLIDVDRRTTYHCGNFLGQYVGVGMDHLRYYLGLMAKHLDAQVSLLVAPEFNNGLPASLVGNPSRRVNMGLKGLQLSGNSMMPLLTFLGNSLADRFPTHAEQFNQNINSQGFGSANLARQSIDLFQHYISTVLLFGVQAVDLRTYVMHGHYDARLALSPASGRLYEAIRHVVGRPPSRERPYIWNDNEQFLDLHVARLVANIKSNGSVPAAIVDFWS